MEWNFISWIYYVYKFIPSLKVDEKRVYFLARNTHLTTFNNNTDKRKRTSIIKANISLYCDSRSQEVTIPE